MKLSDGEKIIILMLSELHEKLAVNGEIEPEFLRSAIFNDQLWGIRWKYGGIPFSDAEDPVIVKEVIDVLDMWSYIERSFAALAAPEKGELKKKLGVFGDKPRFQGFDGNNESEYMGTALFLVNELDRFVEFKGRSFNCHHPSLDMHRRMLAAFEPMRKSVTVGELSAKGLLTVLSEQVHPSNREA
jgi:uncharacterized protein YfbU (UPF0304 family)